MCVWVGVFLSFFFSELEKTWISPPLPPYGYLNASISDIKSCKTSNVCVPKMFPGYLKINLDRVYGLKMFQT